MNLYFVSLWEWLSTRLLLTPLSPSSWSLFSCILMVIYFHHYIVNPDMLLNEQYWYFACTCCCPDMYVVVCIPLVMSLSSGLAKLYTLDFWAPGSWQVCCFGCVFRQWLWDRIILSLASAQLICMHYGISSGRNAHARRHNSR